MKRRLGIVCLVAGALWLAVAHAATVTLQRPNVTATQRRRVQAAVPLIQAYQREVALIADYDAARAAAVARRDQIQTDLFAYLEDVLSGTGIPATITDVAVVTSDNGNWSTITVSGN
jgi:hypothetical protein